MLIIPPADRALKRPQSRRTKGRSSNAKPKEGVSGRQSLIAFSRSAVVTDLDQAQSLFRQLEIAGRNSFGDRDVRGKPDLRIAKVKTLIDTRRPPKRA